MKRLSTASTLFILMFCSLDAEEPLAKGTLERMVQPKISLESSYITEANVKGSSGGYEVAKNNIKVNNAFLGFEYMHQSFIWNGIENLPFGDGVSKPIEELHTFKIESRLPYKINDELFWINSISGTSSFEDNTEDSFSAGVFSLVSYKLDDEHSIQFGTFANYHPTTSIVLPVISYSYRARHQDGFKFILGFPRAYVGYHLNRSTLLRVGMIYSQSVAKLSDDSVIEKEGYIETKDYMANIGISYEFTKDLKVQADVLYELQRDINTYDKNGDLQDEYSVESSVGMNFKIVYFF